MAEYEEVLARARALSPAQREQLARALGAAPPAAPPGGGLHVQWGRPAGGPAPQSAAWLKAEQGHAVLATDTGPAEADIPAGAEAIAGMWADAAGAQR